MKQPTDIITEIPILLWGKIVCIEQMGNDNWKHRRDYKAVLDLTRRWLLVKKQPILDKLCNKMEDQYLETDIIGWDLLEAVRVIAHDYLREFENGKYNPDPDGCGTFAIPDMWIISRIRELTDS